MFELPIAPVRAPERADAVANRERILSAARCLIAERGAGAVSMDEVAVAAGVGKGTVFRRFGDRAGLTAALIDEYMRDFQNAFLSGPPPLGPLAPAADRLEAFLVGLITLQYEHLPLGLAAESGVTQRRNGAYNALFLHAQSLMEELRSDLDAGAVTTMLLGAVGPWALGRLPEGADGAALEAAGRALARGITLTDRTCSERSAP